MISEAREETISRIIEETKARGANAIVSVRLTTSMIMQMPRRYLPMALLISWNKAEIE
jgi:uncharacterized protein YbjQ (UPF0145 family)